MYIVAIHNIRVRDVDVTKLVNNKITVEAWCCKFVWAMTNEACKKLDIKNPLIQTDSTSQLLTNAKKNLRVDSAMF